MTWLDDPGAFSIVLVSFKSYLPTRSERPLFCNRPNAISGLSWTYKMPVAHYNNPPLVSVLMIATGLFVNGPYALITTAVSANLVSYVVVTSAAYGLSIFIKTL